MLLKERVRAQSQVGGDVVFDQRRVRVVDNNAVTAGVVDRVVSYVNVGVEAGVKSAADAGDLDAAAAGVMDVVVEFEMPLKWPEFRVLDVDDDSGGEAGVMLVAPTLLPHPPVFETSSPAIVMPALFAVLVDLTSTPAAASRGYPRTGVSDVQCGDRPVALVNQADRRGATIAVDVARRHFRRRRS